MPRGRPPKDKEINKEMGSVKTIKEKIECFNCGNKYLKTNYYKSYSKFYESIGKIPYCKQCIEKLYQQFYEQYTNDGCLSPEKKAIQRLCMIFDLYYTEDVYNSAMNKVKESEKDISPMAQYMKIIQLSQYQNKTYENTIYEIEQQNLAMGSIVGITNEITVDPKTVERFGSGFSDDDYIYLQREYDDWTARHECNTKAQEEVFKRICFKQLEILKATRKGEDTKNLDATFQNYLDTAKLQPKQNAGDTTADNQTFGTLIDKWENERPLPDIDEDLKDVDKIAWYLDVFVRGHTCRMMGIKNGLSTLYDKFIKKYTVEKPEYNDEENSELLFDTIFGNPPSDDEGVV